MWIRFMSLWCRPCGSFFLSGGLFLLRRCEGECNNFGRCVFSASGRCLLGNRSWSAGFLLTNRGGFPFLQSSFRFERVIR